jgi:hypothetical protein
MDGNKKERSRTNREKREVKGKIYPEWGALRKRRVCKKYFGVTEGGKILLERGGGGI